MVAAAEVLDALRACSITASGSGVDWQAGVEPESVEDEPPVGDSTNSSTSCSLMPESIVSLVSAISSSDLAGGRPGHPTTSGRHMALEASPLRAFELVGDVVTGLRRGVHGDHAAITISSVHFWKSRWSSNRRCGHLDHLLVSWSSAKNQPSWTRVQRPVGCACRSAPPHRCSDADSPCVSVAPSLQLLDALLRLVGVRATGFARVPGSRPSPVARHPSRLAFRPAISSSWSGPR